MPVKCDGLQSFHWPPTIAGVGSSRLLEKIMDLLSFQTWTEKIPRRARLAWNVDGMHAMALVRCWTLTVSPKLWQEATQVYTLGLGFSGSGTGSLVQVLIALVYASVSLSGWSGMWLCDLWLVDLFVVLLSLMWKPWIANETHGVRRECVVSCVRASTSIWNAGNKRQEQTVDWFRCYRE